MATAEETLQEIVSDREICPIEKVWCHVVAVVEQVVVVGGSHPCLPEWMNLDRLEQECVPQLHQVDLVDLVVTIHLPEMYLDVKVSTTHLVDLMVETVEENVQDYQVSQVLYSYLP